MNIICVFIWLTAAVGHRGCTENNPGGRGDELGARFPWPPDEVVLLCRETAKRRQESTEKGSRRDRVCVAKWQSSVLTFPMVAQKCFSLSLE